MIREAHGDDEHLDISNRRCRRGRQNAGESLRSASAALGIQSDGFIVDVAVSAITEKIDFIRAFGGWHLDGLWDFILWENLLAGDRAVEDHGLAFGESLTRFHLAGWLIV